MNQFVKIAAFLVIALLVVSPALAQGDTETGKAAPDKTVKDGGETHGGSPSGPGTTAAAPMIPSTLLLACGAGLIVIGGGFGIGNIGARAVESMARQPEVAGNIQTAMLIAAALIEGATFFGLIICFMLIDK